MKPDGASELFAAIRASGLVPRGSGGVILVSGGPDSACAAAGLAEVCGPDRVVALTLNYGLRDTADRDEEVVRELCGRLGVELVAERPSLPEGNVQAEARDARYAAAERLRARRELDWIATGHTRTDLVETMLYRLAVSPGRRALLGLPTRRGRVIRPLLGLERPDTRRIAAAAGLPFADDPTNESDEFARNRIRRDVIPALRGLSPAAERNFAETRREIAEETAVLDELVAEALEEAGAGSALGAVSADAIGGLRQPAMVRLSLRALAERAAGREVALRREQVGEILRLARSSEGGEVDVGGGLHARCEGGFISFHLAGPEAVPEPVALTVPGECRFGEWLLRAELRQMPVAPEGPERATLDAAAVGERVVVRSWLEGDRMRPLGLGGSKSLQDLFTDQRVPRSMRRTLPVVEVAGRVAWVAGVAVSEEFKLTGETREVAVITARPA